MTPISIDIEGKNCVIVKRSGKTDFKEQKTDKATTGANSTYSPKICQ
jgi:hypothetical protein